ncbi:hypothetical protein [Actinophytocola glycyrrhizae]|uniref:Uncharacterized protein n=1 Tax=Actinophytocola glycyrrhizae TaxID=2044873 RepID=A0ABV9S5C4_9PSEU
MFTTQEAISAEISYRMELAGDAALRARVRRPSLLRRLLTKAPGAPKVVARATPLSV